MQQKFTFEADDMPLSNILFHPTRRYRVPRYQRPYAWEIEEITEFWEDLISNEEPYFLGSFIFNTELEKEDGFVDIIDGQQRLITITILSAVLRDIAKEISPKDADLIQVHDISIPHPGGQNPIRIKVAESLEEYFTKYIQGDTADILQSEPSTPEEKRVKANYEFLNERIRTEIERFQTKDSQVATLQKLRWKVRALMAINMEISREEDAYDIFETTNARGMELSVGDLLKNLIFKNIRPGKEKDIAKDTWKDITRNVEETNTELKRFIRYFWISTHGFVQDKRLFKEVKKNVSGSEWANLLKDLKEDSKKYNMLLEGEETNFQELKKHGSKIYGSVFALRLMNVSQCYVLLLSILRNYKNLGFDPYQIFQFIEKFTFQYSVVCKLPGNRVEKIYSKYALDIHKAAKNGPGEKTTRKLQNLFSNLQNELKVAAPSRNSFMEKFTELSYKNNEERRRLIKYILGNLDSHSRKEKEYKIDFNNVNLEHILPQNPNLGWNLARKDIRGYVNLLGNLTLLSKAINGKAQNGTIQEKSPFYQKSELNITKELLEDLAELKNKWGEEQIRNRQVKLAEIAYDEVWAI